MKELTIQEKSERYDKAIERAKGLIDFSSDSELKILEYVFHELKESEDERIRKVLIGWINLEPSTSFNDIFDGFSKEQILAWLEKQGNTNIFDVPKISIKNAVEVTSRMQYIDDDIKPIAEFIMDYANWNLHKDEWNRPTLTVPLFRVLDALIQKGKPYCACNQNIEKQGEQKPAYKIESKFNVGDWVMLDRPVLITKVEDMPYNTHQYWTSDGTWFGDATKAKLWTIQDANDGDVLVTDGGRPFIFKGCLNKGHANNPVAYCGIDIMYQLRISSGDNWWTDGNVHPATKEQHDLLFTKIKEAGYKLDKNFNIVKI